VPKCIYELQTFFLQKHSWILREEDDDAPDDFSIDYFDCVGYVPFLTFTSRTVSLQLPSIGFGRDGRGSPVQNFTVDYVYRYF
jgi:hypothetical protein